MTRDEHDRQRLAGGGEPALQFESVEAGHRHVEHEATIGTLIPSREERLRGLERLDAPAFLPQHARERLQHARIVVDEEDAGLDDGLFHAGCLTGKLTQNVAPPSALLAAVMRP